MATVDDAATGSKAVSSLFLFSLPSREGFEGAFGWGFVSHPVATVGENRDVRETWMLSPVDSLSRGREMPGGETGFAVAREDERKGDLIYSMCAGC